MRCKPGKEEPEGEKEERGIDHHHHESIDEESSGSAVQWWEAESSAAAVGQVNVHQHPETLLEGWQIISAIPAMLFTQDGGPPPCSERRRGGENPARRSPGGRRKESAIHNHCFSLEFLGYLTLGSYFGYRKL